MRRLAITMLMAALAALLGAQPVLAAQETRYDAYYEAAITGGRYRVAMYEHAAKGSSVHAWDKQSEIYITGSSYAWWKQTINGTVRVPYGICFWDLYTAVTSYANPLSAPFDVSNAGTNTTITSISRSGDGKTHYLQLRTCVTGRQTARSPQPGGGNRTVSFHTTRGRVVSIKHTIDVKYYLNRTQWNNNTPGVAKQIVDKITFG